MCAVEQSRYFDDGTLVNKQQNFVQELRLSSSDPKGKLRWIIGGYFSRQKQFASELLDTPFISQVINIPIGGGALLPGFYGSPLLNGRFVYADENRTTTNELSAFGELTWQATEKLSLTAGGRLSRTKLDFALLRNSPGTGYGYDTGSQKQTPFSPKFAISYQADSDNLFYATASKGFRIGGVNRALPVNAQCNAALGAIGLTEAPRTYGSDSVWSYEVGAKNSFDGGRIRLATSLYYIKWSKIIQNVTLPNCGLSFTTNLADASSKGFELQADLKPFDNLTMSIGVGYNKGGYDQTVISGGSPLVRDNYTLGAAPWTVAIATQYDFAGVFGSDMYAREDFSWQAANKKLRDTTDPTNTAYDPNEPLNPDIITLDLRLGMRKNSADLSFFVKNVLNRHELLSVGHSALQGQIYTAYPVRPRTWGATLSYRF